jgi:ornithine--oxo-acid transaminase
VSLFGSSTASGSADAARGQALRPYEDYVNPQWVRLLEVLGMNAHYVRCAGAELFTADGRRILDFISGYGVYNAGHNHPRIVQALRDELATDGPSMLQSHASELAGELARRLCERAGGGMGKVYFGSSGSEGIEAAIKFARVRTGRAGLLAAKGAFHGLTCGALSLMADSFWGQGFGPLLPGTDTVAFGNIEELAAKLASRQYAALFLEPVQGEGGVIVPAADYLHEAQALCRRYGTLLVLDEVQTGMYRSGPFLAAHHFGLQPDMVVLAKALSGGLVPSSAVLMTDEIYRSVYGSLQRAIIHTSTYSENHLAMRAGLATLEVLEDEQLGTRAAAAGARLRQHLSERLASFDMVAEIRGLGLLCGIAFRAPRQLRLRIPFETFASVHRAMFGQVMVRRLFRDYGILSQVCGNDFMVLKVAPPLMIEDRHLEHFSDAIEQVVALMHERIGYWTEALAIARRVVNVV